MDSTAQHAGERAGTLSKPMRTTSWLLQVLVAVILGQTLFFKFTGAAEAVHLFETLGAEPWGRIGTGIAELAAVVLILVPRTVVYGALLSLLIMIGAVGGHVTRLGIAVTGPDGASDGGLLFGMAVTVLLASAAVLIIRRRELPVIGA